MNDALCSSLNEFTADCKSVSSFERRHFRMVSVWVVVVLVF